MQGLIDLMNASSGNVTDFETTGCKYIDWQDYEGRTALHLSVLHDRHNIAQELLESGAKIDIEDAAGKRPLELSESQFISTLLINKLKQKLSYKKSKQSTIAKNVLDNRDLKALSKEDINACGEFHEHYLM